MAESTSFIIIFFKKFVCVSSNLIKDSIDYSEEEKNHRVVRVKMNRWIELIKIKSESLQHVFLCIIAVSQIQLLWGEMIKMQ